MNRQREIRQSLRNLPGCYLLLLSIFHPQLQAYIDRELDRQSELERPQKKHKPTYEDAIRASLTPAEGGTYED